MLLRFIASAMCVLSCQRSVAVDAGKPAMQPVLQTVGPRLVSNQTRQPLQLGGAHFVAPLFVLLGPPLDRRLTATVVDSAHAVVMLPPDMAVGPGSEALVSVRLEAGSGQAELRVANDTEFPDLTALTVTPDGAMACVASGTEDVVYVIRLASGAVERVAVGDGPAALAVWADPRQRLWVVVAHQFESSLALIAADTFEVRRVPGPSHAAGVTVAGDVAYVTEHVRDSVVAVNLRDGTEQWRALVDPNPREIVAASGSLLTGSLQVGSVWPVNFDGGVGASLEPAPGTPIVSGTTAKYSAQVMNGKAPRGLAWSPKYQRLFVSSIGPNVGPNADKMEVSMNGGVGVVDPRRGWLRHVGFGAGVTEALALDDRRGLLFATDVGLGLVRVLDVARLVKSDEQARRALLQTVALPVPEGFPLVRPSADFGVQGRAGLSLHTGPKAAALLPGGDTLVVLERFTGRLTLLDVRRAAAGQVTVLRSFQVTNTLGQKVRRRGQVLFFADLGQTAMSCDACHLEGHTEGVLFEKTMPLRIYRSPTVRGSRETPPYFTPASTFSMGETMKVVGGRNRYHNPDPTPDEIESLTLYGSLIPTLPNPFLAPDGTLALSVTLPDGSTGSPSAGQALFEGKAECRTCHPAPHFTTDQDVATRGRYIDVGTPQLMPLRVAQQNPRFAGFAAPALIGSWDVFPMLTTGLAGLTVTDGGAVRVETRQALQVAIERWAPTHGRADLLTVSERRDLLAYVLSL